MANGLCDRYCKDCVYAYSYGDSTAHICTYYLTTSIRRPCPAGEGCTVKKAGRKIGKWEYENTVQWEQARQRRKELWREDAIQRMQEARKQYRLDRMRTLTCPECGKEFMTDHPRKIYCSVTCKSRAKCRAKYWRDKKCKL